MIKISIEKIKMDIMDIFIRWFLNIFQYIRVKAMNKTFQIYFSNQFDRPSCIEMSVIPRNPLSRYYLNRASYLVERTPINAPHRKNPSIDHRFNDSGLSNEIGIESAKMSVRTRRRDTPDIRAGAFFNCARADDWLTSKARHTGNGLASSWSPVTSIDALCPLPVHDYPSSPPPSSASTDPLSRSVARGTLTRHRPIRGRFVDSLSCSRGRSNLATSLRHKPNRREAR